ncbi:MAG TPA: ATP-dependent DNA ligase [Streptosporangiaceae bacterium]|nr:ATP-dependent DNA ligase [Streptosporangiaceae bacterium]
MAPKKAVGEERDGVSLSSLDSPLFDGGESTKRDLVDYLDAMAGRMVPVLRDRPLSVIRVRPGQDPFMQKNLPKYTPDWIETVQVWADASKREVTYGLCNDRRTLLWFANQRAVEYHVTLARAGHWDKPSYLVLDIDPPALDDLRGVRGVAPPQANTAEFGLAVRAAQLVQQALADVELAGAVKTSGAKGLHIFVPLTGEDTGEDAAAVTRAIAVRAERIDPELATTAFIKEDRHGKVFLDSTRAHGATVAAAYSPRIRPGTPVSFPVSWDDLPNVTPADFTIRNAVGLIGDSDPWAELMPVAKPLPTDLVQEGHTIPVARVQAMHEGKRRARERRAQ